MWEWMIRLFVRWPTYRIIDRRAERLGPANGVPCSWGMGGDSADGLSEGFGWRAFVGGCSRPTSKICLGRLGFVVGKLTKVDSSSSRRRFEEQPLDDFF